MPTILQLSAFNMKIVENVVTASARSDRWGVSRWVVMADRPGVKMKQLAKPGKRYQTFDRKLATGLAPLVASSGEWGRKVTNVKRKIMAKKKGKQQLLAGRQILVMLYQYFRANRNMGSSTPSLTSQSWSGSVMTK